MCLSRYQVDRAINKLKKLELLDVVKKKANGAPTLHYKLDMDKLTNWICEKLTNGNARNSQMDLLETDKSLTEITTEITTERDRDETSKLFQLVSKELEIIQSPLKAQQLEQCIESFKDNKSEIVQVAIDYCKQNNKGINYLIKVLENWSKEGVKTKEEATKKIEPKKTKKTNDFLEQKRQELFGG
ncbi:DnaD domain protein [Staphylococcus pseudintermedius]|nr:DnaD domain protein [Staphylococcus pseudintermedius]